MDPEHIRNVNETIEAFRFKSSLSSTSRVLRVLVSQVGVQVLRLLSHVLAVVAPVPATILYRDCLRRIIR
jgi:hypothetical protein